MRRRHKDCRRVSDLREAWMRVFPFGHSNILIRAQAALARAQRTWSRVDQSRAGGLAADRGSDAANSQCVIGALMMRCPASGRTVNSGVFVQETDIRRLAQFRMSVRCPHCGEPHDICVGEARIDTRGMLPRPRPQLTVVARNVA
jgi:hypothetical protein